MKVLYVCSCSIPPTLICNSCLCKHLVSSSSHTIHNLLQSNYSLTIQSPSYLYSSFHSLLSKLTQETQVLIDSIYSFLSYPNRLNHRPPPHLINLYDRIYSRFSYLNSKFINYHDYRSWSQDSYESIHDKYLSSRFYSTPSLFSSRKNLSKLLAQLSYIETSLKYFRTVPFSYISQSGQATRYIFHTIPLSRRLQKYDGYHNRSVSYDISNTVSINFYRTSVAVLPDGNIMMVGGYNNLPNTYKLNPITGICTEMKQLNYPRCAITLFCYGKYLYAFGGFHDTRVIERMPWRGNGWEMVGTMIEARSYFGSYYMDNKLFILGGERNTSIEYYDFLRNKSFRLKEIVVPEQDNLTVRIGRKIYLIKSGVTLILNTKFEVKESISTKSTGAVWTLTNFIVSGKRLYYWDENSRRIMGLRDNIGTPI
jgi:hypothetical protein